MKAHDMDRHRKVLVGITGAYGSLYAVRLLKHLSEAGVEVELIATEAGIRTMGLEVPREVLSEELRTVARFYENGDIAAPPASGTFHYDAHLVVPCSMNTMPERIEDLVDFICLRVMGLIGVRGDGLRRVAANYLDGLATEERNGIAR